jgi:protease secretion system outer membrane protein
VNFILSQRALALAVKSALMVGTLAYAGSASSVTLMQAYEAALSNDPTYRSAAQESAAGKEYVNLGRSNLLPQISGSYSSSKIRADLTQPIAGIPYTTHPVYYSRNATAQVRQTLFNLDAYARYKQGVAQTNYSNEVFDLRTQEMLLRVTSAYIDVLFTTEQVELSTSQRDTLLEQKKVNDRMFEKGEGTRTDMLETQSKLDLAEAQLLESLDNQQNVRATLSTLIGGEVGDVDQLRPDFRIAPLPEGGFETLKKSVMDENPDIKSQMYAIDIAKQEVNKARAGHAPRVDLVASYTKSTADTLNTYTQDSTQRAIGIQVNIPLYSGGAVNAQSRQAVANLEKAKADLQVKLDKIELDLRKSYLSVVSSTAKISALNKAVESAQMLVLATEQSIKGGVRINLDLLNAKQQLYTSQRDLAQARYTYLLNRLKVRAAAGTLGREDLVELTSYFR